MADPLKERIAILVRGEAQGRLKPEHQAELDAYRAKGTEPDKVLRRQSAATLAKEQPGVDQAYRTVKTLDEFDAINRRLKPTGGVLNRVVNTVNGWLGDKDLARLDQLAKGFSVHQRQPGSGSSSDYDARMYLAMSGSADQPFAANVAFSKQARDEATATISRHQFRDAYLQKNGSLIGSDEAYARQRTAAPPSTRKPPSTAGWSIKAIK